MKYKKLILFACTALLVLMLTSCEEMLAGLFGVSIEDRIIAFENREIREPEELIDLACAIKPGQPVEIIFHHGSGAKMVVIVAGTKPIGRARLDFMPSGGCLGLRIQEIDEVLSEIGSK